LRQPARIGVVALDEGIEDDEQAPAALVDRLAFHLALDELPSRVPAALPISADDIAAARARLPKVASGDDTAAALCQAAAALGVASLRAPWLALRAACAVAALQGHDSVEPDDAALAARLVLAPRATQWPSAPETAPASMNVETRRRVNTSVMRRTIG
jgi:magnesium chelatase subunit D